LKQVLQSLKNGNTEVSNVPIPAFDDRELLIETHVSLLSAGTERMLVDFGKAGLVSKAKQQPDKVRMVVEKLKTDGLFPTLESVLAKLDQPLPMGYCNVGKIHETGRHVIGFNAGDRVASNGKHAEFVSVSQNLCARIPVAVSDEEASFTVLGSIALQGIRLVQPTLGECVVVYGVGVVGLLTVQLLRAQGCRVLALDYNQSRLDLACQFGAEVFNLSDADNPVHEAMHFSRGRGVDAVIITVASQSNDPVSFAAKMSRQRGRIVLVGVTGLQLSREDFFEKELSFQVSCSYGPGRYDPSYEEQGNDYPVGFVRWTEQRNFEAVLDMMEMKKLDVTPLISHRFDIADSADAYGLLCSDEASLGILLTYNSSGEDKELHTITLRKGDQLDRATELSALKVSLIGAGNYASKILIPAFKRTGVSLHSIASSKGVSGLHAGRKFGFRQTTTDVDTIFDDPRCRVVVVASKHNTHANFVLKALRSGKHVFVEKPLCLSASELDLICKEYQDDIAQECCLMVGFNRRFSPHIQKMKSLLLNKKGKKAFVMTINAGAIPTSHWTQDFDIGGGRLLGEACHFVDLLRFLAGKKITSYTCTSTKGETRDTFTIQLSFEDQSIGTIHYFANGAKAFPKERLEVFCEGGILQLNNFRSLSGFGWRGFSKMNLWRQDKGQQNCVDAFVTSLEKSMDPPIPFHEIEEVSRVCIALATQQ
jgi:predicted dehydrogenase/threonine dehydrogenase-like Zn-dependent dehydrogenase